MILFLRLWTLLDSFAGDQAFPCGALFGPVGFDGDLAEFSFSEFRLDVGGGLEVEECLLDVGGEGGEVEDLRDSGAGDAGGAGDFGLVFELAGFEQVVQSNSERHQFGDVWDSRWCRLSAGTF